MSSRARPKVSVVIPCYNQGVFLDDAVSSAREAYDGPLQIVVVDDGSTDPLIERQLAALAELGCEDLTVVRQPNGGLSRARNAGLAHATGEFVQFLDADDLLCRGKIDHQVDHLSVRPDLVASICDYYLCDGMRTVFTVPPPSITPFALTLEDFLYSWERGLTIPINAALFRRSALAHDRTWNEGVRAKEDWLFWVGLKLAGAEFGFVPLRLCVYRLHGSNMTRSWAAMGTEWMRAAAFIERWLDGRDPEFMERCSRWYVEFYLARATGAERDGGGQIGRSPTHAPAATVSPAIAARWPPRDLPRGSAPRISVVVPVFNHAQYLQRCIRSAHEQTLPPVDVVCVDDASTDPAVRPILEKLAGECPEVRIRLLDRNVGIAAAQNMAVQLAQGDFVAFLDCDDYLAPTALETVARAITGDPRADYFFTDRVDIDESDRVLRQAEYGGYSDPDAVDRTCHRENLLDRMIASHLKVLRRTKILEMGGFDAQTSGVQDWDLALRIAADGALHYVPKAVYYHRVHARSVTMGERALMFRLTNEVRRRHQTLRAGQTPRPPLDPTRLRRLASVALQATKEGRDHGTLRWDASTCAWRDEVLGVVLVRHPRRPRDAYRLWAESPAVVFALEPGAPAETVAFLREFNSYFDLVLCSDGAQWAMLHRCMWSARALRMADEACEPSTRYESTERET
jgi:glycosyltransferase involved in cell wall biosynthesis